MQLVMQLVMQFVMQVCRFHLMVVTLSLSAWSEYNLFNSFVAVKFTLGFSSERWLGEFGLLQFSHVS